MRRERSISARRTEGSIAPTICSVSRSCSAKTSAADPSNRPAQTCAAEVLDRALAINGNSALAFGFSALIAAHSERHERAVEHAGKALRLSPLDDPLNYHPYCALALTYLFAGRFAETVKHASLAVRANPGFSVPYIYLVAGQVHLGNTEAAQAAAARLLDVAPGFSVAGYARTDLFRAPLMDRITTALRAAGLPESHGRAPDG